MIQQPFDSPGDALAHFGTKGMKWGIRKERDTPDLSPGVQDLSPEGVTVKKDGSISIDKGANIQRLVRSNGKSMPMKDITYASVNAYDNARYIKHIGGKGVLGGGRDTILSIQVTQKIQAPSFQESTRIHSELLLNNPEFRKKATLNFVGDRGVDAKELKKIAEDPTGSDAQGWYKNNNIKMTFDKTFDPDAPYVQKTIRDAFQSKGYNALRDENDAGSLAKAPIIIFSPEKTLRVVGSKQITDAVRKANKQQLKQYKKNGKDWVDRELYGS